MRSQIRLLSLVARATVILLTFGAFLVVLGIFDNLLDWDIFSPSTERFLYGIFGSAVALGGFGAAICVVLGIQEMVGSARRLADRGEAEPQVAGRPEATRRRYRLTLAGLLAALVVTLSVFGAANRRIEARRIEVFKRIAQDQVQQLGPRIGRELAKFPAPCEECATPALGDIFGTLNRLTFFRNVHLYRAEAGDPAVLWRYPASPPPGGRVAVFERLFVARDDDRAVQLALAGDSAWIRQKNGGSGFVWYHLIADVQGKPLAVLQIHGNPQESFREYEATARSVR